MQCFVGLRGLSGKQAALACHSGYVAPKCQTDVVMLLTRLSLACWELPWVFAQPHTADTYPGGGDRFQQPCPCVVQRRNQPNQCHGTWLRLQRGAEARTSDLASLGKWVLEKFVCMWWTRTWGQHIPPAPFSLQSSVHRQIAAGFVRRACGWEYDIQSSSPFREPVFPCRQMQDWLHLCLCTQVPIRCRGGFLPRKQMCSASSCWAFLSGTGSRRHKVLNSGSSEVLRMLYKAICVWLNKPACTWPALAAVHQRDVHRAGGKISF